MWWEEEEDGDGDGDGEEVDDGYGADAGAGAESARGESIPAKVFRNPIIVETDEGERQQFFSTGVSTTYTD